MTTKIVKYLLCIYILFVCVSANAQSLTGDVQTVTATGDGLYPYFKAIAYNCIFAGYAFQWVVVLCNVAFNGGKAKKAVKQIVISTAITGLIWAML